MNSIDEYLSSLLEKKKDLELDPLNLNEHKFKLYKEALRAKLRASINFDFSSPFSISDFSFFSKDKNVEITKTYFLLEKSNINFPLYVLKPKNDFKGVIIALHGHGSGVKEIIDKEKIDLYQHSFAYQLAQDGFLVFSPELIGFGELRLKENLESNNERENSCHRLSENLISCGKTILGVRLEQVESVLRYVIKNFPNKKIGLMGISGGATVATFLSALDEENSISALVISGYANLFKTSILAMRHCVCNYVPNLIYSVELDDILSIICPKPMLWETGKNDPIYPEKGAREAEKKVKLCYEKFSCLSFFEQDYFDGKHEISFKKVPVFFEKHLK